MVVGRETELSPAHHINRSVVHWVNKPHSPRHLVRQRFYMGATLHKPIAKYFGPA